MDRPLHDRFVPPGPIDIRATLGPLLRYPTGRVVSGEVWRATRTTAGPATIRIRTVGTAVDVQAWGPGAAWVIEHRADLAGASDEVGPFEGKHPVVRDLHRRNPGVRIPKTRAVFEALVPAILEQKVQGGQARRAYKALVWRYGEPAPGPGPKLGLRLAPAPETLARLPAWAFHSLNVERKRAVTITTAARYAEALEACVDLPVAEANVRLRTLPGIGAWTAAEVAVIALGDTDAVSVGDFHLPNTIAFALAGEPRADDARMLELLEPWRGHRARVVKLIEGAGIFAPRYGPRLELQDIRGH